jgi:mRNA-degrading endonuclease HigB of HigAB toxin-antitoxin module
LRIIAKKILRDFWELHPESEQQLKAWYQETSKAEWTSPNKIKAEYIKTDMPANKAETLAKSEVDYEEYLKLVATVERIKEFLSLARKRSAINEF